MNKQTILALDLKAYSLDPSPTFTGRPKPGKNRQYLSLVIPDLAGKLACTLHNRFCLM